MHLKQPNGSLGALGPLGPLGTFVVMKCVKRGHRLTYDPSQYIQTKQLKILEVELLDDHSIVDWCSLALSQGGTLDSVVRRFF